MISKLQTSTVAQAFAQSLNSDSINLLAVGSYVKGYALALIATVTTPAPKTFTAATTDICTAAAHGYLTGLVLRGTTTTTLPAGLSLATDYYVIKIDANTFKLATSLVNANAGIAVDITSTGTGVHTLTATALAGGSYKTQGSVDGTNWNDLMTAVNITGATNILIQEVDPMYKYVRVVYVLTTGQLSISQIISITGN